MALGPRLDLRQSQSLVMTPQLQQAIRLLAASNLEIEAFIGEALENNPLLEAGEMRAVDREVPAESEEQRLHDATPDVSSGEGEQALDIDPDTLDRDRDTGDWSAQITGPRADDDLPDIGERAGNDPTLAEHLEAQVGPAAPDARTAFVARHIVGLLDEAGYLTATLREVAGDLGVTLAEAEAALKVVQSLDPTGVGARTLSECLALQAIEADRYDPCMKRLIDNLDLVARGEFARLKRMCDVDDEDFADMLAELRGYDPKPGLRFGGGTREPVVPDVLISPARGGAAGEWDIRLNEATLPRLVVNRSYYVELRKGCTDKASRSWLGEKLADAGWLIKALDQRAKTILKVAAAVVKAQDGFFRKGVSELRPLTLRAIAEEIEMHESTVSRVTSNKYLTCDRGTFELKYFFSSGVGSADGEGASAEAVKAQIRALCDAEDPGDILSDDKLVDLLKDKGFDLARRTVAKYREAIGIGSSVQRRRQKKLARIA
ncbi:RNA polymerase factor sigma-54 [Tsuneonella sp. HG222]